jgi:hypothetical protein
MPRDTRNHIASKYKTVNQFRSAQPSQKKIRKDSLSTIDPSTNRISRLTISDFHSNFKRPSRLASVLEQYETKADEIKAFTV